MTDNNLLKNIGIKAGAIVYMSALTIFISYYISKVFEANLWANERIAITAFITLSFLASLVGLCILERSVLKLMLFYHFVLLGTVICIFIDLPFTPFVFIAMVITSVYGIRAGLVTSITVGCVLIFKEIDLYPIYIFGIAPIIIAASSCLAVWKSKNIIKNSAGSIVFVLTEVLFVSFFCHYCKEINTIYQKPSFALWMIVIGILCAVLANIVGIALNWVINKETPSFYMKKISDDSYTPIMMMKKKSTTLYYHSTEVAELARLAAKRINVDYELAYAGGLYHDIGKLAGQEYIKEGVKIADKYKLPQSVRGIMIEHNVKSRVPRSKESAIVMLCDTAVSAVEYLKGTMDKKDMSEATIIENALNKRMLSGALDKSGLTIEEFATIKEVLLKVKEMQ